MHPTVKELGIDKLTVAQRILLVEEIWDSIASEPDALEVPDEHRQELGQRLESMQAAPEAGSSWQDVKERLAQRCRNDG